MITVCRTCRISKIEVGEAVGWKVISASMWATVWLSNAPPCHNKVQITACNRNVRVQPQKLDEARYRVTYTQQTTPSTDTTVKGIDVSKWQGEIDWNKVKADGVKFAMIRLGYGSADGNSCGLDGYFEKNVANALKAGIDIGCYFYSYATSVAAAKKEAAYVVSVLQKYKGVFTYPWL